MGESNSSSLGMDVVTARRYLFDSIKIKWILSDLATTKPCGNR